MILVSNLTDPILKPSLNNGFILTILQASYKTDLLFCLTNSLSRRVPTIHRPKLWSSISDLRAYIYKFTDTLSQFSFKKLPVLLCNKRLHNFSRWFANAFVVFRISQGVCLGLLAFLKYHYQIIVDSSCWFF